MLIVSLNDLSFEPKLSLSHETILTTIKCFIKTKTLKENKS
jgi:hypothetical protein